MENIKHQRDGNNGSFIYYLEGRKLAEMVYVISSEKLMVIDHTEVDESLKGQGIGKKLLATLVEYVRAHEIKVIPMCPFAQATFQKTTEWQDMLANFNTKQPKSGL